MSRAIRCDRCGRFEEAKSQPQRQAVNMKRDETLWQWVTLSEYLYDPDQDKGMLLCPECWAAFQEFMKLGGR